MVDVVGLSQGDERVIYEREREAAGGSRKSDWQEDKMRW